MVAHAPTGEPAGSSSGDQTLYGSRAIRDLYPGLREDRLRYLERWGVIRPARVTAGERFYAFADLAALRYASAELASGVPFRSVVRDLRTMRQRQLAEAPGAQLSFDFQPAREDVTRQGVRARRPTDVAPTRERPGIGRPAFGGRPPPGSRSRPHRARTIRSGSRVPPSASPRAPRSTPAMRRATRRRWPRIARRRRSIRG